MIRIFTYLTLLLVLLCKPTYATHLSIPKDSLKCSKDYHPNGYVYVCTGTYSYAYHSTYNCAGLNNCQAQIITTDESTAIANSRVPCCRCWTNVNDRCKDEAKPGTPKSTSYGGGGGGGGEAYIIVAAAVAVVGLFTVSDEISVSRIHSFYDLDNTSRSSGSGWDVRLRKDFAKSGLEYGVNFLNYNTVYNNGYGAYSSSQDKFAVYLNYVHDINIWPLIKKPVSEDLQTRLVFYAGPSIRIMDRVGLGGVLGVRYKLFRRVNADLRYEYTTQSNQIQAGIQLFYKKFK